MYLFFFLMWLRWSYCPACAVSYWSLLPCRSDSRTGVPLPTWHCAEPPRSVQSWNLSLLPCWYIKTFCFIITTVWLLILFLIIVMMTLFYLCCLQECFALSLGNPSPQVSVKQDTTVLLDQPVQTLLDIRWCLSSVMLASKIYLMILGDLQPLT